MDNDNVVNFAKLGAPSLAVDHDTRGDGVKEFETLPENVVAVISNTALDVPVHRVLQQAFAAELETVVIVGLTKKGAEYFNCSVADAAENIFQMERAKLKLLRMCDDPSDKTGG